MASLTVPVIRNQSSDCFIIFPGVICGVGKIFVFHHQLIYTFLLNTRPNCIIVNIQIVHHSPDSLARICSDGCFLFLILLLTHFSLYKHCLGTAGHPSAFCGVRHIYHELNWVG